MTVRWRLRTSSYLRTSLRISWFCCSTCVCAERIARATIFDSTGGPAGPGVRGRRPWGAGGLLPALRLRRADRPGDHLRLDGLVVGHAQRGHHRLEHRAVEPAHQVVAEGEVEPRLTRVALPARPAAQLVVDP